MQLPKYEGEIEVPEGGWEVEVTEFDGGTTDVVIAGAGTYFLKPLCTQIASALTAASTSTPPLTYTVTIDDNSETSTGKITIAATGGVTGIWSIVWTSTAARDALGFTAGASSVAGTGAKSSPWIWLPDKPRAESLAPDGLDLTVTDSTLTIGPSGVHKKAKFAARQYNAFSHESVLRQKMFTAYEVVGNESLETWWGTVIAPGYAWRYYRDRSDDATYRDYIATGAFMERFAPQRSMNAFLDDYWSIRWDAQKRVNP